MIVTTYVHLKHESTIVKEGKKTKQKITRHNMPDERNYYDDRQYQDEYFEQQYSPPPPSPPPPPQLSVRI